MLRSTGLSACDFPIIFLMLGTHVIPMGCRILKGFWFASLVAQGVEEFVLSLLPVYSFPCEMFMGLFSFFPFIFPFLLSYLLLFFC